MDLVVNNETYRFQLESVDANYLQGRARGFCQSHAIAQTITGDALENDCTQPIFQNLVFKINQKRNPTAAAPPAAAAAGDVATDSANGSGGEASTGEITGVASSAASTASSAAPAAPSTSTIFRVSIPILLLLPAYYYTILLPS